ncbi:hypothetical protein BU24DRAFT_429664 [Aaosphaeria arxii CBS 175.79]|uniref:Uncharacterized protein n=1 Tax=Aaosphaeria arxii CBS 175.79 TaxID=1450172 RepID=A0A6A5Y5P9_9PLEO|nr:uncharacterized protein BU24DRAFT_429664 [Aaosphaeria arxii CBS 175.79]KAF2020599.1 hypothetical protein BU24DRAFT_429664 [Aaosphaeria arxii CBS 175.79]
MFHSNSQALVHLPGKSASDNHVQFPRGECGFIVKEDEAGKTTRQRCPCRSFFPADPVVRTQCGCGHQAWYHEAESLSTVTMEEYATVIEEVKRLKNEVKRFENLEHELKQELHRERLMRENYWRTQKQVERYMYENMRLLKVSMDDKVEAVVDKTEECNDQIKAVQERLTIVDEVTMELENRLDRSEHTGSLSSREATPGVMTPRATPKVASPVPPVPQLPLLMQPQHSLGPLPIRSDKKYPLSWSVRVIFVPRKSQRFAFDPDSTGYRRCATRKLQHNLDFPSQDSSCFANRIENAFKGILRGRPWMPMIGHRPADEPYGRMALQLLPPDLVLRDVWDYPFLEDHCIAHDKMQGDVLYITLQYEDVTWNEIRFLPAVAGADESCWRPDEELDGAAKYKSLDSEIMYDFQDPPPTYSSRTHSVADRHSTPSRLDVLADSASLLSRASTDRGPSRSTYSPTSASERNSLRSFTTGTEETDDEHRDKKPKLRSKQSMPNIHSTQQPMYVSGRSKRKMPVREKGLKEPLRFNVTNVAKWRPNLLHPHSSKGKEAVQESH